MVLATEQYSIHLVVQIKYCRQQYRLKQRAELDRTWTLQVIYRVFMASPHTETCRNAAWVHYKSRDLYHTVLAGIGRLGNSTVHLWSDNSHKSELERKCEKSKRKQN